MRRVIPSVEYVAARSIVLLGLVLSVVHLWHLISHDKPLLAHLVGSVIPLLFALGIVYAGYWVVQSPRRARWAVDLSVWTVLGTVAMGTLAGLIVLHQYLAGALLDDALFLVATAATGGSLVGFLTGMFHSQYRRKAERIETIHEATQRLMAAHTKEEVCEYAVEIAADGLDMPLTGVWLYDEDDDVLEPVAATADGYELFGDHPVFEAGNSISWEVYQDGTPRYIADISSHPAAHNPETSVQSELVLPLGKYGVFNIGSPHLDAFDDIDVTTAKILASTTTAALELAEREETLRAQHRELQQQAAHLEDFARTVSHDLRNPLNVASLSLELAREGGEDSHFESVEAAHERMENIIEDVLWLAREGKQIDEKETVSLEQITRTAWTFVDTEDATLRCDCDGLICADSDRLQQLFENLFRNAVEHGSTSTRTGPDDAVEHSESDITVTVGTLGGGFYVEDTGEGIPEPERGTIFDAGYSSSATGTGFGLAIVEQIIDAHGWEITATESEAGGARFEITGVETVDAECCVP